MQKKNYNQGFYIILSFLTVVILFIDVFVGLDISLETSSAIEISITFLTIIYTVWFSYLLVVKQFKGLFF